MIKKIIYVIMTLCFLAVLFYFGMLLRHGGQNSPGTIDAAYYIESAGKKIIVVNDYISRKIGYKGSGRRMKSSWLISLDAVTGKELKRIHAGYIDYVGMDNGKLWMISSDSTVGLHSRDPYSLEITESYTSLLAKAEAQNPVSKGKIAEWELGNHGNMVVTTFDATKYYFSPVNFKAHECTNERSDDRLHRPYGLSSVDVMEQNRNNYMAYKDGDIGKNIYELDGRQGKQLYHLDEYPWTRMNTAWPTSAPMFVTKKHLVNDMHFVDAAFVYDAFTKLPLCFNDECVFIYHHDRVGKGQRYLLTQVEASGAVKTQYDITQTDPARILKEAFVADGKLYLVFAGEVQCRDVAGKIIWQYTEDTMDR
ncbi:MAG TPA: hypothetical protein VGQ59_15410 [Cyclobacteriaceae bacterium]|nr:hypothetical protein [Cyclobacteriaceae bacterium]